MSVKISHEIFVERIKKISPDVIVIGIYSGCDTPIECKCRVCGNIWYPIPRTLNQGSQCPKCAIRKRSEERKRGYEDVVAEVNLKNPDVEFLGEYRNTQQNIEWRCKKCGKIWVSRVANLLNGNTHCADCSKIKNRNRMLLPNEEFTMRLASILPTVTAIDCFDGYYVKIRCMCKIHNEEFLSTPHSLLSGKCGCSSCCESHGERKMRLILNSYGLWIIQQYSFDDCKDISKLKFDAYSEKYKIAFEYNGEQHYRVVDFSGKNYDRAKRQYDRIVRRDKIKRNYCANKGIRLIEIPYWEFDNMESYIKSKLPWLTKTSLSPCDEYYN